MFAGFWQRVLAHLIDEVVLSILGYLITAQDPYLFSGMGLHALWVGLACSFLYFGVFQTRWAGGQTPGKRLSGIQVVKRDGGFLTLRESLIRYLVVSLALDASIYGGLAILLPAHVYTAAGIIYLPVVVWMCLACFFLIPLHPLKRGLHDLIAGSVVVYLETYDVAAVAQENRSQARRAMWALGAATALVVSLGVAGARGRPATYGERSRLVSILRSDFDVRDVSSVHTTGVEPFLSVEVFLPLAQYDDATEHERVRSRVHQRARSSSAELLKTRELYVVLVSGFDIGIYRKRYRWTPWGSDPPRAS